MLSKKIILISTITLCFSIVGCKEEAKTTKWYRDHPDELKLAVSYTHLRAHETKANLVCRLLLEKKKQKKK